MINPDFNLSGVNHVFLPTTLVAEMTGSIFSIALRGNRVGYFENFSLSWEGEETFIMEFGSNEGMGNSQVLSEDIYVRLFDLLNHH